jgi:hypothetical protein
MNDDLINKLITSEETEKLRDILHQPVQLTGGKNHNRLCLDHQGTADCDSFRRDDRAALAAYWAAISTLPLIPHSSPSGCSSS